MITDPFDVWPFLFLRERERQSLQEHMQIRQVKGGSVLIEQGDTKDETLFILLSGEVEVQNAFAIPINSLGPGRYFGERRPLFQLPRDKTIIATTDITVATVPGDALRELVQQSPQFARSLYRILRDKQGLFSAFNRFLASLEHGAAEGHIVLAKLLRRYKKLNPALHSGANDWKIDWDAFDYAVRRLPKETPGTVSWFLTAELPNAVIDPELIWEVVDTQARRRAVYQMLPGKLLVLLRDGRSDLIDLICCLCIYTVEARKLRKRLQSPEVLTALFSDETKLPFTEQEHNRLTALWGEEVPAILRRIVGQHEDFAIHVNRPSYAYDADRAGAWSKQLQQAVVELTGQHPSLWTDELQIHIISSNTHSVDNVLSPWLATNHNMIIEWGQQHRPALTELSWENDRDLVVALSRAYLEAHPEKAIEKAQTDNHSGVCFLPHTAYTGIAVQLFDLTKVDARITKGARGLLINIDYAFGEQASPIMARLINLFGKNIRSVHILGKAGGLVGQRGDVLITSRFVEQRTDSLLSAATGLCPERLKRALPKRNIHIGPILTVAGTILQNDVMLHAYQNLFQCVGLEMEGIYYARQIAQAQEIGLLCANIDTTFTYYVSDLPLVAEHTLSGALGAHEGIPPLYAITRQVLHRIRGYEEQSCSGG